MTSVKLIDCWAFLTLAAKSGHCSKYNRERQAGEFSVLPAALRPRQRKKISFACSPEICVCRQLSTWRRMD